MIASEGCRFAIRLMKWDNTHLSRGFPVHVADTRRVVGSNPTRGARNNAGRPSFLGWPACVAGWFKNSEDEDDRFIKKCPSAHRVGLVAPCHRAPRRKEPTRALGACGPPVTRPSCDHRIFAWYSLRSFPICPKLPRARRRKARRVSSRPASAS